MDDKLFSLKILIHCVNLNMIIFNEDYREITHPAFALKFAEFPVITVRGKRAIRKVDVHDMEHLREVFKNGASTVFQISIEELQKLLKERPIIMHFLDDSRSIEKPAKALGRIMISLNNFNDNIVEPLIENSENFKRHTFSLLDAMANMIGQVDLSISLAQRNVSYINRSIKRSDKSHEDINPKDYAIKKSLGPKEENNNFMLTTFGAGFGTIGTHSQTENDVPHAFHKIKNHNDENRSPHYKNFSEDAKVTIKKSPSPLVRNKDAVVQTHDKHGQEEFDKRHKNFNDEFFMKRTKKLVEPPKKNRIPEVDDQIIVTQPTLSLLTEGHFCPPVMFLHKKTNEESESSEHSQAHHHYHHHHNNHHNNHHNHPHSPYNQRGTTPGKENAPGHKRASSKIKIIENEVIDPKSPVFPKSTSPKYIFNPFIKQNPPSLESLKQSFMKDGSNQGLLDALIEELIALRSLRNNLQIHDNVKKSTDKLSSARAHNMIRNPSDDALKKRSILSAQDLRKSREFVNKAHHEVEEDYADDFDSVSMSYREGKKSIIDFQASQSNEKLRKPNGNSKLKQSMVSHISENYGEDFESYSQSASRIKTDIENSSNFGNSSSQKTAVCYICNEKIDPKKANEHIKICKKSNIKQPGTGKKQHSNKNLMGSMDNASASIVSINEEEEMYNGGDNSRRYISRSESRNKTEEYEDDFEEIEEEF